MKLYFSIRIKLICFALFLYHCTSAQDYNFHAFEYQINTELTKDDVKYMYHEAFRNSLYDDGSVFNQFLIWHFYENRESYSHRSDPPFFVISDKHTNEYIRAFKEIKELEDSLIISTENIVSAMDFYFHTPYIKKHVPDLLPEQALPLNAIAYFEFSDILKNDKSLYYLTVFLFFQFAKDQNGYDSSGVVYTFEFEKCKSGLIFLNRKIYGSGSDRFFQGRDGEFINTSIQLNPNRFSCK
jgi:hypothetical protein